MTTRTFDGGCGIVDLERRLEIETPDGVAISLTLAGAGSRMLAAALDFTISIAVFLLVLVGAGLTGILGADFQGLAAATVVLFVMVLFVGVPIAFETLASGRTIGKMALGIRVVNDDGSPVRLWPSIIRNLARFVDLLPGFYAIGFLSVLMTKREQRIGDLMAGTVVVRDRIGTIAAARLAVPEGPRWDVRMVTPDDVAVATRFLDRVDQLQPTARTRIARSLAETIGPKVSGAPHGTRPEDLLRGIVAYKLEEFDGRM